MCGRFVSASAPDEIARYFGAELGERSLEPSYNVAPTNEVFVVLDDGEVRRLEPMRWGLVPSWAKDPGIGSRMINARAEGIAGKNAYKRAFKRRRCIVPADGFYEWTAVPGQRRKQPYYLRRPDEPPLRTCTVITGPANEAVAKVHDRMPVILPPERWGPWLDPSVDDVDLLGTFLVPAPAALITMHPVSTEVNTVRNKGPELIEPVPAPSPADGDQTALW